MSDRIENCTIEVTIKVTRTVKDYPYTAPIIDASTKRAASMDQAMVLPTIERLAGGLLKDVRAQVMAALPEAQSPDDPV